jgi:hypothetical protein
VNQPAFVTHYYRASRQPFQNLSDLEQETALDVMRQLMRERQAELQHRIFGGTYLKMRCLTEQRLREGFLMVGGQPTRAVPHYFVLGESPWFRGLAHDMQEIRLPISDLPASATSFTYPDSFTAMGAGPEFGFPQDPKPHHGRVYLLQELERIVTGFGLPASRTEDDYGGYEHRTLEHYIEVQLWSDEPITQHRARNA